MFVAAPGSAVYNRALAPPLRADLGRRLAERTPPLVSGALGLTTIDGVDVPPTHFNENLPLRDQPRVTRTVPGAGAIQRALDHTAWAEQIVSPVAFATLLRNVPLSASRPRRFLYQIARSDRAAVNSVSAEVIQAGDFADRVILYRHDLNFPASDVPPDPHRFVTWLHAAPNAARVSQGAQRQIATFFASDGATVIHPTPAEFWEVPIMLPLPKDLFFLPRPQ